MKYLNMDNNKNRTKSISLKIKPKKKNPIKHFEKFSHFLQIQIILSNH